MDALIGQVALVTGASRGIGRGIAVALAQAGADVAINYFGDDTEAQSAAAEIEQTGQRVLVLPGDVSDSATVDRLVADTVAKFGKLSMAVASAVFSDREPFYKANLDGFRRTIDVTMWGTFHLLRSATRQMIAQGGGGVVVLVSSPHAYVPVPDAMAYNMAKAAVDQMARTAAIELIDHRVRVNVVTPGWIDTPGERKYNTDEAIQRAAQKLPWGRLGTPEEIGRAVVFLCDPASDYVTGARLLIDGGVTLPWWAKGGTGVPQ